MVQFFTFVIGVIVILWLYLTYKWIRALFDEDQSKVINTVVFLAATGILIIAGRACWNMMSIWM